MILASPLSYPLHPASWRRPAGSIDYRVTNTFDGPDFLNGGQHRAVDVGNFRRGDAVKSPARCRGRGLRHTDGALGVRFDLGSGVTLELWHLDSVSLLPDRWTPLAQGQIVGTTGATGARLPNGQPMPAHTHIAAARNGVPFDPEPHLPMAERPAKPIPLEDDMTVTMIVTEDWTTRTGPAAGWFLDADGNRKHFTGAGRVTSVAEVRLGDGTDARLIAYGQGEALVMPRANLIPIAGTRVLGLRAADCSAQETTITRLRNRLSRARTAVSGARQAVEAAEEALA